MGFFKAYDMRGTFGEDFDLAVVYKVGKALPNVVGGPRWLVGRDCRATSPQVHDALVAGLRAAGAQVEDLGLSTTPMVYFFTAQEGFDGSAMITASHNPPTDNGIKVSRRGALPVGFESGLADVEARVLADADPVPAFGPSAAPGTTDPRRLRTYVDWLKAHAGGCDGLRFAVDCSDGMASILARELFPQAVFLNDAPDGRFPHHTPNPLLAEARGQLAAVVRERGLDCGVLFDGDADRCVFVDETGAFIQPDYLIPVLASTFVADPDPSASRPSSAPAVIHDVRTSRAAIEAIAALGFRPVIGKVGHAYAKVLLRETDAVCGGELAGHYYFRDFCHCDSGELAALRILGAFARAKAAGRTVSALMAPIARKYANSGELNFKVADKPAAIARVLAAAKTLAPETGRTGIDGYRIEYAPGWISVRQSNTEPYLRLLAECDTPERLAAWVDVLSAAIRG
ncbi:MAG: phosphomannomutase/phosphoglucomutase [Kiritimatiellia bacterium]